jgi:ComF family protein
MSIVKNWATWPTRCARQMIEFVYASRCAACHAPCEPGTNFCEACAAGIDELAEKRRCPRCAMPLPATAGKCSHCHGRGVYPFQRVVSLGKFASPIRDMVHHVKYHRRWELAEALADRMWQCRDIRDLLAWSQVLVPVPLHWTRQIERGFDQSEVIARRLGQLAGIKSRMAALRTRSTGTQTAFPSAWKRRDNVRGAFALAHPRWIQNLRVTVVDDVFTTGATARSLAGVLQQGEPAALSMLVLAVADPRRTDFETV